MRVKQRDLDVEGFMITIKECVLKIEKLGVKRLKNKQNKVVNIKDPSY